MTTKVKLRAAESYFLRLSLPPNLGSEQRGFLSQLLVRIAQNFSFQGLEDWTIDLPASVKVLGIEREFHDLTLKGKMKPEMRVYFGKKTDAQAYKKLLASVLADLKTTGPYLLGKRDWLKAWRKHYRTV